MATSYESYKKQLEALKGDSDALQRDLISKAVDALAYNASVTLDGKHEDKLPMHQFWDNLSSEDIKKLRELLKLGGP